MAVQLSTLSNVANDATLVTGQVIASAEHNASRTAHETALNNYLTSLRDNENNYASGSAPADTPAGKWWFNSTTQRIQYYKTAGGVLVPVSGIHPNSYISATGTAGTDNTLQIVKSITLPAGSLNTLGQAIRIRAHYAASNTTSTVGTLYLGTAGTSGDSVLGANTSINMSAGGYTEAVVWYVDGTHVNIVALTKASATSMATYSSVNATTNINNAADMKISLGQDQIAATHLVVYAITIELLG